MQVKKDGNFIIVKPCEYEGAIRNPLKGLRPYLWTDTSEAGNPKPGPLGHEYGALRRHYIKWSDIEDHKGDGADRIADYCNRAWEGIERHNIKIIPRVYLQWGGESQRHWPSDLVPGDWEGSRFKERLKRLVIKLGEAWDKDPRVAYIEMGIYGKWGEHHSPEIPPDIMALMGDSFRANFREKLVMRRKAWDFCNYSFGIYWDSFAHMDELHHAEGILKLGDFWKREAVGGECAYDWGNWRIQPGDNAADSLTDPVHRDYIYNMIRTLHANHLGWIDEYARTDKKAAEGAAIIQKALGYRFVIREVKYPARIEKGDAFNVSFKVRNTGSSPFYYHWPVEMSLLDPATGKILWKERFKNVDAREWLPGDGWNADAMRYDIGASVYTVENIFVLPSYLNTGEYVLMLSMLDPSGGLPSVRFAIRNYYNGGRHPIGRIGVGTDVEDPEPYDFDDMQSDWSVHYIL